MASSGWDTALDLGRACVCMHVHMCVCTSVCTACVCLCMCVCTTVCTACMCLCVYVCVHKCVHYMRVPMCVCVCTSACTACVCLCVYVCAQVCALHACPCVCTSVCTACVCLCARVHCMRVPVCTSVCTTCVCLCVCVHKCVCTVHYWGRKYGVSLQALSHVLLPLKSFHNSFNKLPEKRVSEKKLLLKTPLLEKMPWLSPVIWFISLAVKHRHPRTSLRKGRAVVRQGPDTGLAGNLAAQGLQKGCHRWEESKGTLVNNAEPVFFFL